MPTQRRIDPLMTDHTTCIGKARTDIRFLEPRIPREDRLRFVTGRQHPEHVLDCQSTPPDDRFPPEDPGVDRDPAEERVFVLQAIFHGLTSWEWRVPQA